MNRVLITLILGTIIAILGAFSDDKFLVVIGTIWVATSFILSELNKKREE